MLSIREDKIVHAIGGDFDDCFQGQSNKELLRILRRQGERAYAATFFYSSSNRQSWAVDDANRQHHNDTLLNDPTSSFLPFKTIAEQGIRCTFWSYLLADAYAERPFGYSYARAILRATDDTAYHPGYVFDEKKFSLIYAQTHLAALNMRNCDFLSIESRPTAKNWMKFPFKSNAAFVYIQSKKVLLYVNKAQRLVKALDIKAQAGFDQMLAKVNDKISNMEHDFEMFYQGNTLIKGITLSDIGLKVMESISGHLHEKKDWLIIYDDYDDRKDILSDLATTYKKLPFFLPRNLILRLNIYSAEKPDEIVEYCAIAGTGDIDTKPDESVVNMAKLVLQKKEFIEDDFLAQHSFSDSCEKIAADEYFKNRSLAKPTVAHQEGCEQYALHKDYNCILLPNEILMIRQFIKDKKTPSSFAIAWAAFFNENPESNFYFDPIIRPLESLLISQTKDSVIAILNRIFDPNYQADYLKTIGEDSELDMLLRNIHARYIGPTVKLVPPPAKSLFNPS